MLVSPGSLLVTFSRQGENEEVQIALTGEKALTAALVMLMLRDELRAGDCCSEDMVEVGERWCEIGSGLTV